MDTQTIKNYKHAQNDIIDLYADMIEQAKSRGRITNEVSKQTDWSEHIQAGHRVVMNETFKIERALIKMREERLSELADEYMS